LAFVLLRLPFRGPHPGAALNFAGVSFSGFGSKSCIEWRIESWDWSRRKFTKEFKLAAVRRLEQGTPIAEVSRGLEVNPNVLHRWGREFRQGPGNVFPGNGKQRWSEGRIAELERKVGQQTLEIDFLKGCLQRIEEQRMLQALTGNPPSSGKSRKK
jgi:transposase